MGEATAAIADMEKAIELAPDDAHIRWSYGWALLSLDKPEKALAQWRTSLELHDPDPWWSHHTLAIGYWGAGRKTEEGVRWPQYFDGKGWGNVFGERFGIRGIPTTVLVDREGIVRHIDLRGEALARSVRSLLSEEPNAD